MKFSIPALITLILAVSASPAHAAFVHVDAKESANAVLKKEHAVIIKVVNALRQDVEVLREGGSVSPERLQKALDFFTNFADACHHRKEENHYFPQVKGQADGPQHIMVSSFLNDHALYRVLLEKVRAGIHENGVDPAVAEPLAQYLSAVSLHICRENRFFEKSAPWLPPGKETILLEEFEQVEQELGENFHRKYAGIARELAGN